MSTPEFILRLREKIGHDLLWIPGVTGVVLDPATEQVLLVRRTEDHPWALITGLLDPGEQPGHGVVREVFEETGVHVEVEQLLAVESNAPKAYDNGDQIQAIDMAFRCRALSGEARVNDDENVDVRWFALDDLPELPARHARCLARALEPDTRTWFAAPPNSQGPDDPDIRPEQD